MRKYIAILAMTAVMAGCAAAPNYQSKALSLEMGMSKSEVVALLGEPKRTSARSNDGQLIERYAYWAPKQVGFSAIDNEMISTDRITVKFVDGKVAEWGDSYDPAAMTERSLEMQRSVIESMQQSYSQPPSPE
ncbi:hypothetical protein [Marinobacter shengliensis]|uniref:hypothetical protein n=1 Tax=Marinobacter shengliensis TaxID=1389223 RepID=UPI0011087582|nr:hypothetical protein [Marinobacter shengliensis]